MEKINFLLLLILLLTASKLCHAQTCKENYEQLSPKISIADQYFSNLKDTNPKLYRILSSPALQRWTKDKGNSWNFLLSRFNACSTGKKCSITVVNNDFIFDGSILKNKSEIKIEIRVFALKEDGVRLSYGETPKGINAALPSLFGVILSAVNRSIDKDPEIKIVKIIGVKVVNSKLAKQLKELNFQPKRIKALLAHNSLSVCKSLVKADAYFAFGCDVNYPIKIGTANTVKSTVKTVFALETSSWQLALPVAK